MKIKYNTKKHTRKDTRQSLFALPENLKKQNAKRKEVNKIKVLRKAGKITYKKRKGVILNGTSTSVSRSLDGIPLAAPPRSKNLLGNLGVPSTEGKAYLEKEKRLGQVEIMMLKGIVTVNVIAVTLKLNYATAKKYVEQVHYRWAILGGSTRMLQVKGEAKQRLDLIHAELWKMFENTTKARIKGMVLNQLIQVHDRKLILDGITPKTIPLMPDSGDLAGNLDDRIKDHTEMVRLASALLNFTGGKKENRKEPQVIEDARYREVAE